MVHIDDQPNALSLKQINRFICWMFKVDGRRLTKIFFINIATSLFTGLDIYIISVIVGQAIGVYQGSHSLLTMNIWIIIFLGISVITSLTGPLLNIEDEKLRLELEESILISLQDKTSRLQLEVFEQSDFYDVLSRGRRAVDPGFLIEITYHFFSIIRSALSIIVISTVIAHWNPWLLIAIIIVAIPGSIAKWIEVKGMYELEKSQIPEDRKRNYLANLLSSNGPAKEIRTYSLESWLLQHWRKLYWIVEDKKFDASKKYYIKHIYLYTLSIAGLTLGIAWCGFSVVYGNLSPERFAAMLVALNSVSSGTRSIFEQFPMFAKNLLELSDFYKFMDNPMEERMQDELIDIEGKKITIQNLSYKYPQSDAYALKNLFCSIKPGEKIAIVGENGSGKTTFVKLITGLYQPTEGMITFGNKVVTELNKENLRSQMSIIFQDYNRYAFTVQDNIGFGKVENLNDMDAIKEAAQKSGADKFIESLSSGYNTLLSTQFTDGTDLSVGQWQRVAIARAMMRNAALVILDEPTSALDPIEESETLKRFLGIASDKTAIVVTHRLGLARYCDKVLMFRNGSIIEQGHHDELLSQKGEYYEMWNLQSQWYLTMDE